MRRSLSQDMGSLRRSLSKGNFQDMRRSRAQVQDVRRTSSGTTSKLLTPTPPGKEKEDPLRPKLKIYPIIPETHVWRARALRGEQVDLQKEHIKTILKYSNATNGPKEAKEAAGFKEVQLETKMSEPPPHVILPAEFVWPPYASTGVISHKRVEPEEVAKDIHLECARHADVEEVHGLPRRTPELDAELERLMGELEKLERRLQKESRLQELKQLAPWLRESTERLAKELDRRALDGDGDGPGKMPALRPFSAATERGLAGGFAEPRGSTPRRHPHESPVARSWSLPGQSWLNAVAAYCGPVLRCRCLPLQQDTGAISHHNEQYNESYNGMEEAWRSKGSAGGSPRGEKMRRTSHALRSFTPPPPTPRLSPKRNAGKGDAELVDFDKERHAVHGVVQDRFAANMFHYL